MSSDSEPVQDKEMKALSGLGRFLFYFLRLGACGFGGPIALAGYRQRDLVEERKEDARASGHSGSGDSRSVSVPWWALTC